MSSRVRRSQDRPRDGARQIAAVLGVAALLAGGLFAAGRSIVGAPTVGRPAGAPATKTAAAGTVVGDDTIYTGSILYMPDAGRTCRQFLFDNQTGRFSDNGYVDCVNAAYHSPSDAKLWPAARARIISNAFRHD